MATQWVLLWWCFSAAFAGIVSDTIIESCPSESLLPQQPISAANEPREAPSIYMMTKSELGREIEALLESSSEDEFEDEYDEEGEYGWESEYEGVEEELEQEGEMNESDSAGLKEDRTPGPGDDLGVAQLIENTTISEAIYDRLAAARTYFREEVFVNDRYAKTWSLCRNKEPLCATWAIEGECDNNPSFMKVNCAPVCFTCEMVHIDTRCVVDPSVGDALYPGDLNRMFERILADPAMGFLLPKVLSRPYFASGDTPETADYQLGIWLVNFENFSTVEEADYLVEYGHSEGYKRSADVGEQLEDGTFGDSVNDGRTSTNAWCENECYNHTLAQAVMKRIEFITGIPEGNQEHLQLLHYQPGQYYRTHNDYIDYQQTRPVGVRILTLFIYLNDVEEGGETNFPRIGLSVKPKKGSAILWPSIFDSDPNKNDSRSDHQAMDVIKGVKYGANSWIHQRDVKRPENSVCL